MRSRVRVRSTDRTSERACRYKTAFYQVVYNNHGCFFFTHANRKRQEKEAQVGERRIREMGMLWITYALKVKDRSRKTRMCVDVGKWVEPRKANV